jgi:hypothetical protein
MPSENNRSTTQSCFGGCLVLLLLLSLPVVYFQIRPHLKHSCPIEVRVLDLQGHPQAGVEIDYLGGDIAPLIPMMPFGPARKIRDEGSVITDSGGYARFRIKHDTYVRAVRRAGTKVTVHHSVTKNWTGQSHTFDSINGAGIAQWFPAPTATQVQTTEIVLADTP